MMRTFLPSMGLLLLSALGCSAGERAAGGSGSGGDDGTSSAQGNGMGQGGGFGGGLTGGGGPGAGCSSDLQFIVDENGNTITQCPPDQGCAGGACVPACAAAAASKGSIGCEYFTPTPPFYLNASPGTTYDGPCHAMFLANTWSRPAKLTVSHNGTVLDATTFGYIPSGIGPSTTYAPLPATGIPPGEVAVLFLAHRPGVVHGLGTSLECPRAPAVLLDTAIHNTGRGQAFDVVSDTPVTSYDILPFGGSQSYLPSASLLFPRTSWGDNYYIVAPHATGSGSMWTMLVGIEDGTTVDIRPTVALPAGGGVPALPANTTTQITIGRGEIVQWSGADPTSAVLQSSRPVGVWSGNTYLRVSSANTSGGGQDSAHQQIGHVGSLGHEYVGAGIMTRLSSSAFESVPYRVLGVVDGTSLVYDPAPPPGAPLTLNAGQVAEFEANALFSVASQDEQHPFAFTQYMPGTFGGTRSGCGSASGGSCGLGDEEWVIGLPPQQFLSRYVFFTDPTYATTNLVITRVKGTSGFADVDVACLGAVTGFQPVGTAGKYEVAHIDLSRGFTGSPAACATSNHEATSAGAFGVTVWGTDYYASYGYPAGGNIGTINSVVIPPE